MTRRFVDAALLVLLLAHARGADAEVSRFNVQSRARLTSGGVACEVLTGTVEFIVDPRNPHDAIVADIANAPLNRDGRVVFTADLAILRPLDPAIATGTLLLDVVNRGNKTALAMFDRARGGNAIGADADLGDGFLMKRGFTLVWVGWQGDLDAPDAAIMRMQAPVARQNGKAITGWVRHEATPSAHVDTLPLADAGQVPSTVVDPAAVQHVLTVRDFGGPRQVIARGRWRFVNDASGKPVRFAMDGGFDPGRTYELVYRATDPIVAGLGLVAIRDVASFIRYDRRAPLHADRAIAFGFSQSARLLRTFLYDGFNADEAGRAVFDGFLIHAAGASRGSFNQRFAQPSFSGPGATRFPFADAPQTDPETKSVDGLLSRLAPDRPKIFYTNTSTEYWWLRRAALQHTSLDGRLDLALPDHVRLYVFSGTQHAPDAFPPPASATGRQRTNPNDYRWALRALLVALDRWTRSGPTDRAPPPASAYPHLGDRTLVPFADLTLPSFRGFDRPRAIAERLVRYDYGPRLRDGVADYEPPREGAPLPILVPQVDVDGNELGGIRLPDVAVPLATFTGWNPRRPEHGGALLVGLEGSFVPFVQTREDRSRFGDPRRSIEERYASRTDYLTKYREAARALIERGLLLEDDLTTIMTDAVAKWDAIAGGRK